MCHKKTLYIISYRFRKNTYLYNLPPTDKLLVSSGGSNNLCKKHNTYKR